MVAGLLTVVSGVSPVGAQTHLAPVAVAVLGERTTDPGTGAVTVELDGSGSFDPDPGGSIARYRWEVVTEAYQWLGVADGDAAEASFVVPAKELLDRYGPTIEFRLTVTDSGAPPASASTVVVFSLNQGPEVDIAVSAMLPAPRGEQFIGVDDNDNGVVDENEERYTRQGVIHGPGEDGNADNEWDIREGSLLVVDGSGSFDADGPLPDSAFRWELLHASDVAQITSSLPDISANRKTISTDEDPDAVGTGETLGRLPFVRGETADPYHLYYRLTVTDSDGVSASKVVRIVIRDAHEAPTVKIGHPESDPDAVGIDARREGVLAAGKDRYVISVEAAEDGVTLTATGAGDGTARTRALEHTWSGTGVVPSGSNEAGAVTTAVFTAPRGTAEGDSFMVSVEVVDPSRFAGSTSVELVVADTRAPIATAPLEIDTPDGSDGGFPVVNPPTGRVTLEGLGFDPDFDPITYEWEQVKDNSGAELTRSDRVHRVALNDSTTPTAWFDLPEVTRGTQYVVYVQLTVTDRWGVSDTDIVKITIRDGDDDLIAMAGDNQRVESGEFVRLFGNFSSRLVSADAIASVTFNWAYVGIETHPRTERRAAITDAEKREGYVPGQWFPNVDGTYEADAGGLLKDAGGRYPYFDAPDVGEFNSVKLIFELTVGGVAGQDDDSFTTAILIVGPYFSGVVSGPDYCANLSLGGSTTHPFDSDLDGVADSCSLTSTRREAVARQNALEMLATLNPEMFKNHLYGKAAVVDDGGTPDDDSDDTVTEAAIASQCAAAPTNLGDDADDLAADSCGRVGMAERTVSAPPRPVDPAEAAEFFSGVVDGPHFCANLSLGGPVTYAYDGDGDGVADVCSLPYTRREAVARQSALEQAFGTHPQYNDALKVACAALGTTAFEGDNPIDLAKDQCSHPPTGTSQGIPLPTPTS